jgi:hypothetical protein
MTPYVQQWKAIRDARDTGCLSYDLYGIPPGKDPSHSMTGLYLFKTGFGGGLSTVREAGLYLPAADDEVLPRRRGSAEITENPVGT